MSLSILKINNQQAEIQFAFDTNMDQLLIVTQTDVQKIIEKTSYDLYFKSNTLNYWDHQNNACPL